MQLIFETHDPQAQRWRARAERRLRFVLRRLNGLVPQARIRLSDLNGPRGGVDKRCQVELRTTGVGTVVVTAVATHWPAALDRALARAGRALLRAWRRSRQQRGMSMAAPISLPA